MKNAFLVPGEALVEEKGELETKGDGGRGWGDAGGEERSGGKLEATEPEKGASSELTGQACSCGVRVGVGHLQGRCVLTASIAAWSVGLWCVQALLLPQPLE